MICNIDIATLLRTKKFAEHWHGDQKYGELPYLSHLMDVYMLCENYNVTCKQLCLLHDVIEDTDANQEIVSKEFGNDMGRLVYLVSDEAGPNRKTRKEATNEKFTAIDPEDIIEVYALIVKAADRLANMLKCQNNPSLMRMYIREFPAFNKAVYRSHICNEIWGKLHKLYDMYK